MGFTLNSWTLVRTPLLLATACLAIAGCGGQGDDEPAGNGGGSGYDAQIGDMIVPDGYAPTACQKDKDCAKGWECMDIPDQGMFCVPDDPAILLPNCLPVPEACNGLDDDCDGKIDDDSPCDDGNACNGTETCTAGICQAGKGTGCEDDNVCTTDACDPEIGCTHNVSTAVTCEDGDACTGCIVPAGVRSVYLATAAAGCPEAQWSGCNALWMPGFYDGDQSHIVRFELSAGARFDWYADGTGHLSGTAFAYNLGGGPGTIGEKWDLSVWFKFRGVGPAGEGSGGPKLDGGWYVPKTLTDSWFYFDMMPGLATMKQAGGKEVVEFTQKPVGGVYPFQVGQGANNKTMAFSSSGWLDFVKHTAKGDIKSHGDINVDLALTSIPGDCDLCQNGKCQPGLAKTCDDGNDCTADSCDAKKGACVNKVQSGTACEDGIACTTGEKCNQGKCKPGNPDDSLCEDGNPCTKDHCTVGVGCVFEGADPKQPCDDSDACTAGDQCQGKKCKAGTALDCDDANPCTEDLCDPTTGCTHGKLDGAACEDGDACTGGDACSNGTCAAGAAKSCDDDNVCTTDSCDPKKGCLQAALDGTGCDDGNACSDGDACVQGKCKSGGPKVCDDGQACTIDSCDWQAGCGHKSKDGEACDDGTACTVGDACAGGLCVPGKAPDCNDDNPCTNDVCAPKVGCVHGGLTGPACDDGSACTLGDACAAGKCTSNAAPDCQDGNECTVDSCDAAVGCVHANLDGKGCTDGNACSGDDLCAAGKCAGGAAISCDDLNGCTTDTCDGLKGCVHTANTGAACDDGNACTSGDACKGTVCGGAALACDDGNVCTDDTCKAATGCAYAANGAPCNDNDACTTSDGCSNGKCAGKAPLSCDDGNPCTIDSCNSGGGCVHKNADGWKCDDGNACSTGDACLGGQCKAGAATACDDDNACTSDGCAAKSGCWHTAQNGGACNDDNACTSGDACQGGVCAGKGGVDCNDGNACTTDSCDKQSGCTHVGIGGKACSDGSACTAFDTCQAGKCVGQTVTCTDNNACTADSCNAATGCVFSPADGGACNDGSACTQKDACLGGKCVGVASGCDDGNPCTTDGCDDAKGCSHVLANGLACDDGNACSTGETCTDGKCGGGVGANCDDGDPCTGDSCGAKGSCIHEPLSNGVGNLAIVSDGATQANGKPAVQTWDQHTSWTASIPGATWIWTSFLIGDPIGDTSVAFTRNFNVPAGAKGFSGKLVIAADNSYACTLNGIAVGQDASEFNYFESGKDTWDLALALKAGSNTLQCTVKNWAQWYGSPYSNPAGLLYKLTAAWTVQIGCDDGNGCTVGDQCFGGKCASGPAKSCDDSNGCTADACNPATGACTSTASSGGSCHDGNACTGACLPPGVIATFQPGSATNSGGHGFWLPGFFGGGTVRFSIDAAQSHFDLYADKAHLHGIATIFDGGGAKCIGEKWSFDIWLKYRGQGPGGQGAGGPKLGVIQSIPKSLTNTWKYFDMLPGQAKLTKVGNPNDYALLTQAPVNSMYPFQFGAGANYFGLNMGACSWLTWQHHVGGKVTSGNGDINLDMTTVNPAGTCDQCTAGKCGGATFSCDDSSPCTADSCNASVGCVHTKIAGCTGG